MSDIEAAARALVEESWQLNSDVRCAMEGKWEALRSALAHAARGEPVRRWRDVEGTLPARRDGDKVARIDPETAIPATGKPWCRLCCGPHIGSDHASTPYAAHPPATGEAGTHAMDVAERCFYAIKGGAPYRDSIRAMAAIIEAERPLPEAREGGG